MIYCDIRACVGCRICEVVCSSRRYGAVSPALSRIRVAKLEEVGLDMAIACLGCLEKPCLECPTDALSVGARGEILLVAERCDACQACVEACPIGAVGFHEDRPLICDLCGGEAPCVPACPTRALDFRQDREEISLATWLPAEGRSSQRRGRYARAKGEPVREAWKEGVRIDS